MVTDGSQRLSTIKEDRQAEVNQAIQLKKLEIIERKRAAAERNKKIKIIVSIVMGIVGIILMLAGAGMGGLVGLLVLEGVMFIWIMSDGNKDEEIDFGDKVKVPSGIQLKRLSAPSPVRTWYPG